jgi:hypothetical protein
MGFWIGFAVIATIAAPIAGWIVIAMPEAVKLVKPSGE